MHGDNLSYAENFKDALQGLYGEAPVKKEVTEKENVPQQEISIDDLIRQANDAFENYLKFQGEKKFTQAAKEFEKLQKSLNELSSRTGTNGIPTNK